MNLLDFKKNKKAQSNVKLIAIALVALFVVGLTTLIGYVILTQTITEFTNAGLYVDGVKTAGQQFLFWIEMFDYFIILLMFTLIVSVTIGSFKLTTPRFFFVLMFIYGALVGFVSWIINFLFKEIASNAAFAAVVGTFPNTILICTNLHWIGLVMIILGSLALFAKNDTEPLNI